ncbi:hypothetical protein AGOR_G00194770 [Albula goreensis]|uniref:Immunoglobulin domain-containing protein n=1 Tax=Albula goreensis TaxID=1534307 RepID=A0A8T3CW40_9TELE|nr:hypothetical protein AGOR_G00194770 [Albula goreensis]
MKNSLSVCVFLIIAVNVSSAQAVELNLREGDTVTFPTVVTKTGTLSDNVSVIGDVSNSSFKPKEKYCGRVQWNSSTGLFSITGLKMEDSGEYRVRNDANLDTAYQVKVHNCHVYSKLEGKVGANAEFRTTVRVKGKLKRENTTIGEVKEGQSILVSDTDLTGRVQWNSNTRFFSITGLKKEDSGIYIVQNDDEEQHQPDCIYALTVKDPFRNEMIGLIAFGGLTGLAIIGGLVAYIKWNKGLSCQATGGEQDPLSPSENGGEQDPLSSPETGGEQDPFSSEYGARSCFDTLTVSLGANAEFRTAVRMKGKLKRENTIIGEVKEGQSTVVSDTDLTGRVQWNSNTGFFSITGLKKEDSGIYIVQNNDEEQHQPDCVYALIVQDCHVYSKLEDKEKSKKGQSTLVSDTDLSGRVQWNRNTGFFSITGLKKEDSGIYIVQNDDEQHQPDCVYALIVQDCHVYSKLEDKVGANAEFRTAVTIKGKLKRENTTIVEVRKGQSTLVSDTDLTGRVQWNRDTGFFSITGLKKEDSGIYIVQNDDEEQHQPDCVYALIVQDCHVYSKLEDKVGANAEFRTAVTMKGKLKRENTIIGEVKEGQSTLVSDTDLTGRVQWNRNTGFFSITGLKKEDSGIYIVQNEDEQHQPDCIYALIVQDYYIPSELQGNVKATAEFRTAVRVKGKLKRENTTIGEVRKGQSTLVSDTDLTGRVQWNRNTGFFSITGLKKEDSGIYIVQNDDKQHQPDCIYALTVKEKKLF